MKKNEAGALLNVNLGAVAKNWLALRSLLSPQKECSAVVKSDAYGLGASEIASALYNAGCKEFFVAYSYEGVELRTRLGAEPVIYVLHGCFDGNEDDFGAYNLIPVLNSVEQIDTWLTYTSTAGHRFPCALHFDTGMSRLGISAKERWQLLNNEQDKLQSLSISLVISHLAKGDEENDMMNNIQHSMFTQIKDTLVKIIGYTPKFSLSATSGMFLGEKYHFDLCRPGCGLYGFYPSLTTSKKVALTNVVTLQSKILQIQETKKGQTVGYGSTYKFSKNGKIATAAIGYADGLRRSLSNCGYGYIGEYKVPIVGRISMDLTTFDVSEVPSEALSKNQRVEILGEHIGLENLAQTTGTIPYEVLTDIGHRFWRQYTGEIVSLSDKLSNTADKKS